MIISKTPYRVSLLGGGSDYPEIYSRIGYGATLVGAIDKFCYVTVRHFPPFFEHKSLAVWSKIEKLSDVTQFENPVIRECLNFTGVRDVEIHHQGDLPAWSGMGTSSAFTVGLLNALYHLKGQTPSRMRLAKEAILIERDLIHDTVGCYSEDTEILTERGWKKHDELQTDDRVLTLNLVTMNQEYQIIEKIWKYQWRGSLYSFKSKTVDLLVTHDHNMLVTKRDTHGDDRACFEKSELLFAKKFTGARFIRRSQWIGNEIDFFELPGYVNSWQCGRTFGGRQIARTLIRKPLKIKMDDWLAFFGLYISEGSLCCHHYGVTIWQKKRHPQMQQILDKFPLRATRTTDSWVIKDVRLNAYLRQFGHSHQKHIPRDLLNLSKRQLNILLRSLMFGDGHVRNDGRRSYYTSSKQLAGDVQEIFQKIGSEAVILQRDRIGKILRINPKSAARHLEYEVLERRHYETQVRDTRREVVSYDGIVWCITVPNSTVYVRRNGNAIWCGNCQDQIAAAHGALSLVEIRCDGQINVVSLGGPLLDSGDARMRELSSYMMLLFTGINRLSSSVTRGQVAEAADKIALYRQIISLATDGMAIFDDDKRDIRQIGELIERGWQIKRRLSGGISNPELDQTHDDLMQAGAIGVKLLGAGAGGFFLVFAEQAIQDKIRSAILDGSVRHMTEVPFRFETIGSRIVYESGD